VERILTATDAAQPSRQLADRAGLVTGAAAGIGAATARALVRAGARVVLADVDASGLEQIAAQCRRGGGNVAGIVADVTTEDGAAAAVDAVLGEYGRLDFAHNNVGVTGPTGTLDELDPDTWESVWRRNVHATYLCMRREIAHMRAQGNGGVIVNTASTAGLGPLPRLPAYVAAKHAVVGLTKAAAIDHGPDGIRVVAVCPGPTDTPMLRTLVGDDAAALRARAAQTPLGRIATADDVAAAVVWLCSDAAGFVSGETLRIDGGRRA
jgi:NAD(P)-dependent dehydrogenase (short-subunit alcohol dehydrogenase family)